MSLCDLYCLGYGYAINGFVFYYPSKHWDKQQKQAFKEGYQDASQASNKQGD